MPKILRGEPVADAICKEMKERCEKLAEKGVIPTLVILRVGDKPADIAYERGAAKRCRMIGARVFSIVLPEDATKDEVLAQVERINKDDTIHGCLMFRPLKDRDIESAACRMLDPAKDLDCVTAASLGNVFIGRSDRYAPCTAHACMEMLNYYGYDIKGKRVTVIGASIVVGKPLSVLLVNHSGTVTMCHIDTVNTPRHARDAEILISAAGVAKLVGKDYVAPGQVVLDVGINRDENGKLCGDVDFEAVSETVDAITPVPGGVGAVTSAVLMKHLVEAAERAVRE